jgi:hypothetical protein
MAYRDRNHAATIFLIKEQSKFLIHKSHETCTFIYYFKWKEINEDLQFHSSSRAMPLPTYAT